MRGIRVEVKETKPGIYWVIADFDEGKPRIKGPMTHDEALQFAGLVAERTNEEGLKLWDRPPPDYEANRRAAYAFFATVGFLLTVATFAALVLR